MVFLRALGLVTEASAGYRRATERSPPVESLESADPQLREAFRERVYGADSVLEALEQADEPLSVATVIDELRDERPGFERGARSQRLDDPQERVRRLLEWAVLLGLAARTVGSDRYRSASDLE
ncbi:hypothetical protein [Haloterrigena salifodinae]|uniref:hypothetical protein n=1 Tax=Haloterrigena salifodinae TaxID=2675099 RepID=UPI000F877E50|nr:hypothetical protein [Haloterrigena salifodinae]